MAQSRPGACGLEAAVAPKRTYSRSIYMFSAWPMQTVALPFLTRDVRTNPNLETVNVSGRGRVCVNVVVVPTY